MDRSTLAPPTDRAAFVAWEFSIITPILLTLATLLFLARLWTRCFPVYRMLADDYVCAIAYVLVVVNSCLFLKSVQWILPTYTEPKSNLTIGDRETSAFYGVIAQPFWAWGMASIKISIALMLLRLEAEKLWRRFLWAMIAFQFVLSMYNMLTQLVGCVPLREMWDFTEHVPGRCWPYHVNTASQITVQVFVILTDWIFALLPISFLRKVQRPLRERVIIGLLMSLGVFAGTASIVKIQQIVTMKNAKDTYAHIITVELWCSIEALTGLIASCVPCLRGPFQRALEYLGVATLPQASSYTYAHHPGTRYATHISTGRTTTATDQPIRMKRTSSSAGESAERIITGNDSTTKTGEIWCTTEVLMEEEERLRTPRGAPKSKLRWSGINNARV